MKHLIIHILILFIVLLCVSCSDSQKRKPETEKGFLDLSSWNFEKDGLVNLDGKWEFYWGKLLEPKDFELYDSIKAEYIYVPGGWARQEEKSYPKLGYATYRLKIRVPDKHSDYNFIFMSIFASAKLWVNGSLCFEKGKVASTKEQSEPAFITEFYSPINYDNNRDTLDIILQVADFDYGGPAGGLRRKVVFGPVAQINSERLKTGSINALLIGISLLMALYHIFLFVYRRNEFSYLVFALLCIVLAFWTVYSSGIFSELFSYAGYLRFGSIGPSFFSPLLVLFYYCIYREEVHKKAVIAFLFIGMVFWLIYLTSSTMTMSRILTIYLLNIVIPPAYVLCYSLVKALLRRRQGSVLSLFGLIIMYSTVIHDALLANGSISGFGHYISSQGFVALIIIQSLVLAQMFSSTYRKNVSLNVNLEKIVKERTRIIDEQKTALEKQNLDVLRQKEEIEAQRDHLFIQKEEITDSLNYAKRIQSAMLPPERYISELLIENFVFYKPREIVSGDFYWIKQVNQYIILSVADCTGHGVPGALMSMLGITNLNEIVQRREITQANQVLNELRKRVKVALRQHGQPDESKDGMDIALCVLDLKNMEMQFSGAYMPLYIIRDVNEVPKLNEFKADPMPIGYYQGKDKPFTNHVIKLEPGDSLYMFTDGFVDQKGGRENKKYMSSRFKKLLLRIQDELMHDQQKTLEKELINWKGNNPQVDDILVIGVRV